MHKSQVLMSFWDKNNNVNIQILEEFPAGIPLEGTGMNTGPRVPVLNIIREEVRREGHCVSLRAHLSNTDSDEIREGGTWGLQRDTTSTLNTTHNTEKVK